MADLSEIMERQMDAMNIKLIILETLIEQIIEDPERVSYIA